VEAKFKKSTAYRLITYIFKCLIPLLPSKEKSVRYRTTQLIAMLLTNVLPKLPYEHDLELFLKLKGELLSRISDRETAVRIQSAIALIKIYQLGLDSANSKGDDGIEGELAGVLIDALQNDSNS
jgi:condensin complex subunit 3